MLTREQYNYIIIKQKMQAIDAYANWMSQIPWTFYGHFTTLDTLEGSEKYTEYWKKRIPPETKIPDSLVLIYWKRTVRKVCEDLYGRRYREKGRGLSWVLGIEDCDGYHKHIHVVVYGEGLWRYHRNCFRALWEKAGLRTGMSRLERYDWDKFNEKGLFYLAKHQIKRENIRDFIQKRHAEYFLKTSEPFWWKKKEYNYLVNALLEIPNNSKQYAPAQYTFEGLLCFGHCRYLHRKLKEKENNINP